MRTGNLIGEEAGGGGGTPRGAAAAGLGGRPESHLLPGKGLLGGAGPPRRGEVSGTVPRSTSVAPRGRASFPEHQTLAAVEFAHIPLGGFFEFTSALPGDGHRVNSENTLYTGKAALSCIPQTPHASRKNSPPPFQKRDAFS